MTKLFKSNLANRSKTKMLALTAVFTSLVIVGAFVKFEIPVIPFTLQTFVVQLTSSMLGPWWGALAIGLYLFMGLIGIPIFTKGGGFTYVLQPTFGYLIGFFIGAIVGGIIINCFKKKTFWAYLAGNIINLLIAYACGMIYFYLLQTLYFGKAVSAYTIFVSLFLIFLPGDLTFTVIASYAAKKLKPNLDKFIYQTATDEDVKNFEENTENSEIAEVACGAINDKNTAITKDIVAKDNLGDDNTIN